MTRPLGSRIPLVFCALLLGCNPFRDNPLMRKARETDALSNLRRWSTAQSLALMEEEGFLPTMAELQSRYGTLKKGMPEASSRASSPKALNGYLYSEIESGDRFKAGLVAYPETPGKSGDKALMILMDERSGPEISESMPIRGDTSRIFFAPAKNIGFPYTRWPDPQELASRWKEIRRRSPKEALAEAEKLMADFEAGKTAVHDPVFEETVDVKKEVEALQANAPPVIRIPDLRAKGPEAEAARQALQSREFKKLEEMGILTAQDVAKFSGKALTQEDIRTLAETVDARLAPIRRSIRRQGRRRIDRARLQVRLRNVFTALHLHFAETDSLPSQQEGLRKLVDSSGILSPEDIVDPWGRDLHYSIQTEKNGVFVEHRIKVWSAGPDGSSGSPDDILLR